MEGGKAAISARILALGPLPKLILFPSSVDPALARSGLILIWSGLAWTGPLRPFHITNPPLGQALVVVVIVPTACLPHTQP